MSTGDSAMDSEGPTSQGLSITKYNVWWRTNRSDGDPPSLQSYRWWENLQFNRLSWNEFIRDVRGKSITHLVFDDTPDSIRGLGETMVPPELTEEINRSLKHLIIRGVERTQQVSNVLSIVSKTKSLESLCLHHMNLGGISDRLKDALMGLRLTHLTLLGCKLTTDIFTSISQMRTLRELNLSYNKIGNDRSLSEKLSSFTSLKVLNLSECELTEVPQSISTMSFLEDLVLSRNNLSNDTSLSEKMSTLTSIRKLYLSGCKLTEIPQSITQMVSLEELVLARNVLSSDRSAASKLSTLVSLKKLSLYGCQLTEIPQSVSEMKSLEELYLSGNNLTHDRTLSEKLSTLTSLKKLNISGCKLTDTPHSISNMSSLEELVLSSNNLSNDISLNETIYPLTLLRKLNLSGCELIEIPQSISMMTTLETINLSGNNLSRDQGLSQKIGPLTSLKILNLSACKLNRIPQSVKGLCKLEALDIGRNSIEVIPEWICNLKSLSKLTVSRNKTLKKLHRSILSLSLSTLDLRECFGLAEPPYYVCEGGLENIRQYYTDLDKGSHIMTLATVAVIGRKMAGKTSLVRSLQEKRIIHTYRTDNPVSSSATEQIRHQTEAIRVDETTRVFNFMGIKLISSNPGQTHKHINVVDFGGDEIYHHAYQLTFRKDCIPIVVVNIIHYEEESLLRGRREATRRVVFDWIAHLYLSCPQLERPLLVLTHKDCAGLRFQKLKAALMSTIIELHLELLHEERLDRDIEILKNADQNSFFLESEIFEVQHGADYASVFTDLEDVIHQRATKSEVNVPVLWKKMMNTVKRTEKSHISKDEFLDGLSEGSVKQHEAVLDFMKRSGEVLWYSSESETQNIDLSGFIFHDVSKVTDMIKRLFNHSSSEHKSVFEKVDLEQMWLAATPSDSTQLTADIAILLLTKFNLIYGPTIVRQNPDCYIIPYFMKRHHFHQCRADINLQGDVAFVGLSVPAYAYQQMTVSFLKLMEKSKFHVYAFGNGASGSSQTEETGLQTIEAQLIHEPEHQRVTTRIKGNASHVNRCWKLFLSIIKDLRATVMKVWPASQIRYDFTCPHCQLLDELNPEKISNPEFILKAIQGMQVTEAYKDDCTCRDDTGIPSSLRYPSTDLKEADMKSLVRYIRSVYPDEQQEITRLVKEIDEDLYDMTPYPQTTLHPRPTVEPIYHMTPTRGRALVINNRCGDITRRRRGRRGSDKDYRNVIKMLQRFGFIISHLSKDADWTSQDIVEAVHQETELVYKGTTSVHEGLGMFVLVMMSHGETGTILGCDNKHVNLMDIYKLLASQNFPAMRGKPKLVILQACSGVREVHNERIEVEGDPATQYQPNEHQQSEQSPAQPTAGQFTVPQQSTQPTVETNIDDSCQTIDDLLVMKPSFDEHPAFRDPNGSYFIRALVATFCRYAGEKDVRTLSDMIQHSVRNTVRGQGSEQIPVTISTFTNGRKLYLSPGVDMRNVDHPDSFTSKELPPPDSQRIQLNWRDDSVVTFTDRPRAKKTVSFEVMRNSLH